MPDSSRDDRGTNDGFFAGPIPAEPPLTPANGREFGSASAGPHPSQFGNPFGSSSAPTYGGQYTPQFGSPSGQPFSATAPPYAVPYPSPPQRKGLPGWAIALISGVGGLFVLGVLAAIVIPVFLNARAAGILHATTLAEPDQIAGLPKLDDATAQQQVAAAARAVSANPDLQQTVVGIYGDRASRTMLMVIAAKARDGMTPEEQSRARAGFITGFQGAAGSSVQLTKHDPGRLGGYFACASPSGPATVCLATDSATLVAAVVVAPDGATDDAVSLSRQAREAVVKR
jgi:hypothetical protein